MDLGTELVVEKPGHRPGGRPGDGVGTSLGTEKLGTGPVIGCPGHRTGHRKQVGDFLAMKTLGTEQTHQTFVGTELEQEGVFAGHRSGDRKSKNHNVMTKVWRSLCPDWPIF